MYNPFHKRFLYRLLLLCVCILVSIAGNHIFDKLSMTISILIVVILIIFLSCKDKLLLNWHRNRAKGKFDYVDIMTIEGYHPNMKWGYLSVTEDRLYFISRKKGTHWIVFADITQSNYKPLSPSDFDHALPSQHVLFITDPMVVPAYVYYVKTNQGIAYFFMGRRSKDFRNILTKGVIEEKKYR